MTDDPVVRKRRRHGLAMRELCHGIEDEIANLPAAYREGRARLARGPGNGWLLEGDGANLGTFTDEGVAIIARDSPTWLHRLIDYVRLQEQEAFARRDAIGAYREVREALLAAESAGLATKEGRRLTQQAVDVLHDGRDRRDGR